MSAAQPPDDLAARFEYESWRGRSTLDEELFVWAFAFTGAEFSGWEPVELRRLALVPPSPSAVPAVAPAPISNASWLTRSVWQRRGAPEEVLEIQVSECDSRVEAHAQLLGALRQFQSPLVRRHDGLGVGDVGFALTEREPRMLLFARANLVYLVRNRGRRAVTVVDAARGCDELVTARPQPARATAVTLRAARADRRAVRVGEPVRVTIDPTVRVREEPSRTSYDTARRAPGAESLERGVLGRAFTQGGELTRRDGELLFRPSSAGGAAIDVFVQDQPEQAAHRRIELQVDDA